jgi:mRNA-degrading endonuclease toxin of MazEF toxin-antitoxin module
MCAGSSALPHEAGQRRSYPLCVSFDVQSSPSPQYGTPPEPLPRRWYQKRRFLLPITAVAAFGLGTATNSNSATSAQQSAAPPTTTTVTSTATRTQNATVTATATVTAKPTARKVTRVVEADDQAVQDILNAWQVAGPKPDQQAAAMAKLRREWPTLAKALEAATGVKAPATTRTRSTQKPAPEPTSGPDVYYANCAAVRAAGAAPLHVADSGYRAGLDRDGDGVACE